MYYIDREDNNNQIQTRRPNLKLDGRHGKLEDWYYICILLEDAKRLQAALSHQVWKDLIFGYRATLSGDNISANLNHFVAIHDSLELEMVDISEYTFKIKVAGIAERNR